MFNFLRIARFMALLGIAKRPVLYRYALSQLGLSKPGLPDTAPMDINCVEALNQIGQECFGIPFCEGASTITLVMVLNTNKRFRKMSVLDVLPGDIIVSPTEGNRHGHCGIVGENEKIMSNDSAIGIWSDRWDMDKWNAYYERKLNLKVYFFRVIY